MMRAWKSDIQSRTLARFGQDLPRLGLGLTVHYSAVGVGVNSALQCGWGWG